MVKISCVIPAYNEGARIKEVLALVSAYPHFSEIIVVDDGSQDNTREVATGYNKVKLIVHDKNQGKSIAICSGIKEAQEELVLMLDADLVGLNEENLNDLINPILNGESDISISLGKNSPFIWRWIGLDFISGQRVLPKKIFMDNFDEILSLPSFGLEVFLNSLIIKEKYRIRIVPWFNVVSPLKFRKYGWRVGVVGDIKMMRDIFQTVSPLTPVYQIIKMLNSRV